MHDRPDLRELLAAAQARVRGASLLLSKPRTCHPDECMTLFREAQGYLEWFRDSLLPSGRPCRDLHRQATALAGEISRAATLLDRALNSGRRWLDRLESAPPGYTACGDPAPQPAHRHLSLLG